MGTSAGERALGSAVSIVGLATTGTLVFGVVDDAATAMIMFAVLVIAPAWMLATAIVSTDDDFPDALLSRRQWLRVLPWTFLTAPLVAPNLVALLVFVRDARADGGRSAISWDRMRPGDATTDHHWPE